MGGHGTAEPHHQRHDALSRQTTAMHDRIHDERNTRHIARTIEERKAEEQNEDERNKRQHRANARDNPVRDE